MPRRAAPVKQKPGPKKNGPRQSPGRPTHQPTEKSRRFVIEAAAVGTPRQEIAACLDIHVETLSKYYGNDIMLSKVTLLNRAVRVLSDQLEAGSLDAAKYTLSRRGGWSEKTDLTSSDGSMSPQALSHEAGQAVIDAIKRKHAKT
jgi:hypothetical protein